MVVDYSKWDKLELSDDSDVEVHPNVDKKSFIRWKQRDVHEKREQMKHNIKELEISIETNSDLIQRMDQLIKESTDKPQESIISKDIPSAVKIATKGLTKNHALQYQEVSSEAPNYDEMIENLLEQIHEKIKDEKQAQKREELALIDLKEHRTKLHDLTKHCEQDLQKLKAERSRHIVSEDFHTGFDSTMINKSKNKAEGSKPKNEESKQEIEVLNPGSTKPLLASPQQEQQEKEHVEEEEEADEEDIRASPDAQRFAQFEVGDYSKCYSYLASHTHIINEHEKDALIMEAFEQQLSGNTERMKQIVHNALLIQYATQFGPQGLQLFFSRIAQKSHPAHEAFIKDVEFTVNHIITRCKVIASERTQKSESTEQDEQVEQIQLHAVDPNTTIVINVPQEGTEQRKVYEGFSTDLQKAISSRDLNEINKVLAQTSVEEAEKIVGQLDECGALSVESKIIEADEWQEMQQELTNVQQHAEHSLPENIEAEIEEMD